MKNKTALLIVLVVGVLAYYKFRKPKHEKTIEPPINTPPTGNVPADTATTSSILGKNTTIKNKLQANASVGLSGNTVNTGNKSVMYGCKDGSTSKTIAGCGGKHGGADWVKTT